MYPIWDNRELVAYAKSLAHAERILARKLQTIPPGWKITAKFRDTSIIALPSGIVYSVHP